MDRLMARRPSGERLMLLRCACGLYEKELAFGVVEREIP
jgi:hypothetical protein